MAGVTTIWRFELPVTDRPVIDMPQGARVLGAPPSERSSRRDCIEIWAEVDDPDAPLEYREFRIVGTGNGMPDDCGRFVGTVLTHSGCYVWHLYEASRISGGGPG